MSFTRRAWIGAALAAGLTGSLLICQHRAIARLRAQWDTARVARRELGALRAENATLAAGQPTLAEREDLRRSQAAVESLRRRLVAGRPAESGSAPSPDADGLLPARAWKFAGHATPRDAMESILWTATHGDVDRLALLIGFSAGAREKAAAFFAQLPKATRDEFGSPEKVFATMLAGNLPTDLGAMGVVAGPVDPNSGDAAALIFRLQRENGSNKDVAFNFQKDAAGWQLLVPADIVDAYAEQLATGPLPLATGTNTVNLPPVRAAEGP